MDNHACMNCGQLFTGEFCNSCGQKLTHRITIKHLGHDVLHAFTHADKGFFHLLIQLFLRPGIVAREYILEGKRKRYFMPFQYLLIIGTVATFVAVNSHFMENTFGVMGTTQYSARQQKLMQTIAEYQGKYFNFIIMLQLPFYALGSYMMYRRYKYNFAELLTLQTFITAQSTIISMFVMLVVAILGKPGVYIGASMSLISVAYHIFAYTQFFEQRSFRGVLRALLTNILSFVLFFIITVLIGVIVGVVISKVVK